MDVLLTVEYPTESKHAVTSEVTYTWTEREKVWAEKVRLPSAQESFEADQQVSKTTSHYRIRWASWIDTTMRVKRNDVIEYISGVDELDRKKFLLITTIKRDNG